MWRESWLVLSAKESCSMASEATENDIGGIDDVPLARNIVRGGAEGTHSKLAFFDTSLFRSAPPAAETEAEGYPPPRGGSKSVAPDRLWALINLSFGPKNKESRKTAGKPAVVCHGNNGALICIKCSLQRFSACKIEIVSRLIK